MCVFILYGDFASLFKAFLLNCWAPIGKVSVIMPIWSPIDQIHIDFICCYFALEIELDKKGLARVRDREKASPLITVTIMVYFQVDFEVCWRQTVIDLF